MDRAALIEQWFIRYSDDVYRFLVFYTGRRDVEDLVQEVFIKAMKALDQFQGRAQPKTWLLTIARNTAIDFARKQRLRQLLPSLLIHNADDSGPRTPEEMLNLNEEKRALYESLQQMRRPYREVLILRGIKGLSPEETATILGWTENRVNVTLHRALKALKQVMQKKEQEVMGNAVQS